MPASRAKRRVPAVLTTLFAAVAGSLAPASGQGLAELTRWKEGRSMRAGSNVWNEKDPYDHANNKDRPDRIEPGETHVLADLRGRLGKGSRGRQKAQGTRQDEKRQDAARRADLSKAFHQTLLETESGQL